MTDNVFKMPQVFDLTASQEEISNFIVRQVELGKDGRNAIVSGKGGVGKSVTLSETIVRLLQRGYKVAAGAMTAKATAVLRTKVWNTIRQRGIKFQRDNLVIETISKLTKKAKPLAITEDGETIFTSTWVDPKELGADALFIDELSMVPQYIAHWWGLSEMRVFGFGDFCQLPEVITDDSKKELAGFQHDLKTDSQKYVSGYGVKVLKNQATLHLSEVLRSTGDITLLCNDLRDFEMPRAQVVEKIRGWAEASEAIEYSISESALETSPDWQIICYTNKKCKEINDKLCINSLYPDLEDKIILLDNINSLRRYNGDTIKFGTFLAEIMAYNKPLPKDKRIYVCMKWQGKMPRRDSPNPVERKFFENYRQFRRDIEEVNRHRIKFLGDVLDSSGFPEEQIEGWKEKIKEVKEEIEDDGLRFQAIVEWFLEENRAAATHIVKNSKPLPKLFMVNADFGYAITTHKAQGSEYPKVCYLLEKFDRPLLYTGISRAKEKIKIINLTKQR